MRSSNRSGKKHVKDGKKEKIVCAKMQIKSKWIDILLIISRRATFSCYIDHIFLIHIVDDVHSSFVSCKIKL